MRSFRIGSAFGIPIKLDITFLLILPVFAWIIGSQVGQWADILNGIWSLGLDGAALTVGTLPWILGAIAAIGLFVGVVLHELGHSLVAIRYGYPIDSITLWILGGIAQLSEQPEDWRHELLIAIAGPAVSVLLGILSFAFVFVVPAGIDTVRFLLGYLALVNLTLAVFNLLPGFPMDGGRVLRALLARNRPFARATQLAAEVGKAVAILMGLVGLFGGNLILIAIAFFIYIGASGESRRTVMNAAFQGVTVSEVMTAAADLDTVFADQSVAELVEEMFRHRHTGFPVERDDRIVGMVTLDDARQITPVERDAYRVEDVMSTELYTIPRYSNAMDALDTMQSNGVGRLLVVDENGAVVGLISRTDVMTAFNVITSSGNSLARPSVDEDAGGQSL
ncbi:Zn-dependent protease fused to CBS domain [Halanaeroarchaeum sp. HSR-CO]|uniref:site-2 protease family protein n=1 Tax=Halanaeroarchaeum sp. HSR-CO TaxID=2866382 RepID=UPI00217DE7F7|nr:site-2 protease family protein [Halanaeroarchaeum sp. HSR-CO]UWG46522.1 Zn-dependent protease fused to CBS domain [Halanaeroarchaeum sp. HSR-CO]